MQNKKRHFHNHPLKEFHPYCVEVQVQQTECPSPVFVTFGTIAWGMPFNTPMLYKLPS